MKALTIGHSRHSTEHLLKLLESHSIRVVVDVRSAPYSRIAPQYDLDDFKNSLKKSGFNYVYVGQELGGRPAGKEFYDDKGRVLYYKVAKTRKFLSGIHRLLKGIKTSRIAILCSEEDPKNCHRRLLVGRVLSEYGITVEHLRGDGRIQSEVEINSEGRPNGDQLALFKNSENEKWKSTQSVLQKKQLKNFLRS